MIYKIKPPEHAHFNCLLQTHNNNNNRLTALCPGLPGWAGTRKNTHPPTILTINQPLSASSIYYDPWHPPCPNYVLGNLFVQPLSMSSLVYLLVWSPPPHIPYISSPNQCLLFAAHAHTIASYKHIRCNSHCKILVTLSVHAKPNGLQNHALMPFNIIQKRSKLVSNNLSLCIVIFSKLQNLTKVIMKPNSSEMMLGNFC